MMDVNFFTRKQLALKLYDYFCGEKERDELYCPISEPFKRTKHVLELCDRTLMDLGEEFRAGRML